MWNWFQSQRPGSHQRWPLDMPLAWFNKHDPWRLMDAVTGTLVIGATGSGKSSGVLVFLALALLKAGLGGLFLCTKRSDRHFIEQLARLTKRESDLVFFGPHETNCVNLLQWELTHGGGSRTSRIENAVQLFKIALEVIERDRHAASGSGDNKYFERAALQLLRSILLVLVLSGEAVTLENIQRFIASLPQSRPQMESRAWRETSYCYQACCRADDGALTDSEDRDFQSSLMYLLQELPAMDAKPRSSIISTYTTMSDMLGRGAIRDTFFSETNVSLDDCRYGQIFVTDYPTTVWNEIGRMAQVLVKTVWQRDAERFDVGTHPQPVFLIADEAQNFISRTTDAAFQATARSSLVATILLSQNLPGLYEAVGGESGRHVIDALTGNLRLKLFASQDDLNTCLWQSELLGKIKRFSFNGSSQPRTDRPFDLFHPRANVSAGFSESWDYTIQPWEWSHGLRNGGPANGFLVDAIAYQGGRIWKSNGKTHLPVTFTQYRE